jgi:hypothetical protein
MIVITGPSQTNLLVMVACAGDQEAKRMMQEDHKFEASLGCTLP